MSNDNMGNLEKLGILVIVILVVVVGVVAITPSETLFPDAQPTALLDEPGDRLEPLPMWEEKPVSPPQSGAGTPLADWPGEEPNQPRGDARPPVASQPGPQRVADRPAPASDPVPDAVRPVAIEPAPAPSPAAPTFRDVTVRKNDSLWRIAEREYGAGKGALYRVIAAANPGVDPDRLREGQTLRVPVDPNAPRGGTTAAAPARQPGATAPQGTAPGGTAQRYTVQRGDTPMGLSTKFYGTVTHYRLLLRHNSLRDANDLQAGMTIEVPPLTETSSNVAPASSTSGAPASGGGRTYTVRKGDIPSAIARAELGDASRWREILELNGIESEYGLREGATIRLPR